MGENQLRRYRVIVESDTRIIVGIQDTLDPSGEAIRVFQRRWPKGSKLQSGQFGKDPDLPDLNALYELVRGHSTAAYAAKLITRAGYDPKRAGRGIWHRIISD
jgi:hypothetical protein